MGNRGKGEETNILVKSQLDIDIGGDFWDFLVLSSFPVSPFFLWLLNLLFMSALNLVLLIISFLYGIFYKYSIMIVEIVITCIIC